MPLSLAEAAKAVGLNKTSVLRAIKAGKISGVRDEHGAWTVEPAELFRVYPPVERSDARTDAVQRDAAAGAAVLEAQIEGLRTTAELLRAQLDDTRKDRDHWRDQAQAITRQLADARPAEATAQPRRWWRWTA